MPFHFHLRFFAVSFRNDTRSFPTDSDVADVFKTIAAYTVGNGPVPFHFHLRFFAVSFRNDIRSFPTESDIADVFKTIAAFIP